MKHIVLCVSILSAAALIGGCPIYSSNAANYRVCDAFTCYDCPDPFLSSSCVNWQCGSPSDCDQGFACESGRCTSASSSSGSTGGASGRDCGVTGCAVGSVCKLSGGVATCVPIGTPGIDSSAPPQVDASLEGASANDGPFDDANDAFGTPDASDAARSFDAAGDSPHAIDGSDSSGLALQRSPCNADGDCGSLATKCVDGLCTPTSELCSDGTQCVVPGDACLDGVCEPRCDAGSPCATGFQCDLTRGVCNIDSNPCSGAGTSTCLGGTTCVEGHCVPPCSVGDAGSACPSYQQCVNGGCLPGQGAFFSCKNDGQSGLLSNGCGTTSICLHHSCYTACVPDAGSAECGNATAQCKDVSVASGTYSVCGTPSNLGSACDVAAGKRCDAGVCLDGYCR